MSQKSYDPDVTLTGHIGTITALKFSPDCRFLASGSDHGVLLIFSTSSWKPLKRLVDASSITTIAWHDTERYLLLCGCESGDLFFLTLTALSEIAIDSASYFGGPIRSLSLFDSTLAVSHGEDVSFAEMKFNPCRIAVTDKFLPNPPSHTSTTRSSKAVAMSLHFIKENHLVVTYLDYGIVSWDLTTMSAVRVIPASARSIGRSILCQDCDTIASLNLIDGVEWYSLSGSKSIASSDIPISKTPSASSLAYIDSDDAIIIGGLAGRAYIVSCQTFDTLEELGHTDRRDIECVAHSSALGRKDLIAIGTVGVGSAGVAPINIWTSVSGRENRDRATVFIAARKFVLTRFTWSGALVYSASLLLCYAWVTHFLTAS